MRKNSENAKLVSSRKAVKPKGGADVLQEAPPGVVRLIAGYAEMKGPGEQDYWDLVRAIASEVAAVDTFDYLAVIDVAEATFDSFRLRKAKRDIIECMRERHRDKLALYECRIASAQRGLAQHVRVGFLKVTEGLEDLQEITEKYDYWLQNFGDPIPPETAPPYNGFYSKSDIAKFARPADTPADDGQAFLDSIDALERIEIMINGADKRRDKALDDIVTRRRKFGELLRASSNRIIDGTVNGVESDR